VTPPEWAAPNAVVGGADATADDGE
jgi:hypothetical protein